LKAPSWSPKTVHVSQPVAELGEWRALQPVHANARVFFELVFADEAGFSQELEVPAHGRARHPKLLCELTGALRLPTQQLDHPAPSWFGERQQRSIERARRH
jgi:hypothetical protein